VTVGAVCRCPDGHSESALGVLMFGGRSTVGDGRERRRLGIGPGLDGSADRDGRSGNARSAARGLVFLEEHDSPAALLEDQEHGDVDQEHEQLDATEGVEPPHGCRRRLGKGPAR
jgi:hypothetical protein